MTQYFCNNIECDTNNRHIGWISIAHGMNVRDKSEPLSQMKIYPFRHGRSPNVFLLLCVGPKQTWWSEAYNVASFTATSASSGTHKTSTFTWSGYPTAKRQSSWATLEDMIGCANWWSDFACRRRNDSVLFPATRGLWSCLFFFFFYEKLITYRPNSFTLLINFRNLLLHAIWSTAQVRHTWLWQCLFLFFFLFFFLFYFFIFIFL